MNVESSVSSPRRKKSFSPSDSGPPEIPVVSVACCLCGSTERETASVGFDFEYETVSNRFTFVRCRKCDHLYLNPRPNVESLGVIYPSSYYAFAEDQSGNPIVGFFREIWESGKVRSFQKTVGPGKKRILDVGCGEGRVLSLLKKYGPPDWELRGVDFDQKAVDRCRQRGFAAEVKRIEDFRPNEKFDTVIMFQLIEHVDDPVAVSKQVRKILNPGGYFILETPNPAGLDYHWFKKSYWGHYHFPRHWNLFTREKLRKMLTEAGFSVTEESSLLSPASWVISLHNFFLDRKFPSWLVRFFHFQNPLLLSFFVVADILRKTLGFPTSNQRMIGQACLPDRQVPR